MQFARKGDKIELTNEYMFTNLDKFALRFELLLDGVVTETKTINMPSVKPLEKDVWICRSLSKTAARKPQSTAMRL